MNRRWAVWVLLAGLGVSVLGDQVYVVALNVWVLARTHSAVAVAELWMVSPLAGALVGSWMGSLVDRWDRRFSLVVAALASAGVIGGIPLLHPMVLIYAAIFLVAAANGLFTAALASYVKLLVPRALWARVSAVRGMLVYGALVLGPALAGTFLIHGNPGAAIWLDSVTFLISAVSLTLLPRLHPEPSENEGAGPRTNLWVDDLRQVRTFLATHLAVLGVLAGFSTIVIFGAAADAQEVVFARTALELRQSGYGYLMSMAGIGYVAGAVLSYAMGARLPVRVALGGGVVLSAASYLWCARSVTFAEAAAALISLGVFQSVANMGLSVYLQESLPTVAMGRIMGTTQAAQNGLMVLAILGGGFLSHAVGVRLMMTITSLLGIGGGLWLTALCLGPSSATRWAAESGEFS